MFYRVAICNNFTGEDWIDGFVGDCFNNTVTIGPSIFNSKVFNTEREANDYIENIRYFDCESIYDPQTTFWTKVSDIYKGKYFLKVVEDNTDNTAEPDDDIEIFDED